MRKSWPCGVTMDTACMELRLNDGTLLFINYTLVERTVRTSGQTGTGCPTTICWAMLS